MSWSSGARGGASAKPHAAVRRAAAVALVSVTPAWVGCGGGSTAPVDSPVNGAWSVTFQPMTDGEPTYVVTFRLDWNLGFEGSNVGLVPYQFAGTLHGDPATMRGTLSALVGYVGSGRP